MRGHQYFLILLAIAACVSDGLDVPAPPSAPVITVDIGGDGMSDGGVGEGEPDLRIFLGELVTAVISRDRQRMLRFFDLDNFEAQRSLGVSVDQYLAEGLGLCGINRVGGSLPEAADPKSLLDSVETIVISEISERGDMLVVTGTIRLTDGQIYRLELDIRELPGGYLISPAVG